MSNMYRCLNISLILEHIPLEDKFVITRRRLCLFTSRFCSLDAFLQQPSLHSLHWRGTVLIIALKRAEINIVSLVCPISHTVGLVSALLAANYSVCITGYYS